MQYITSGNFEQKAQYLVKDLGNQYAILEIDDNDIAEIKNKVNQIEPDFEIKVYNIDWKDLGELSEESLLVATIGQKFIASDMQYTYDISNKKWEWQNKPTSNCIWIHCYSEVQHIMASELLITLNKLYTLSDLLKLPLVLVGDLESVLPYFNKNSLMQQIVNDYIANRNGFMLRSNSHTAFYNQKKIKEHFAKFMDNFKRTDGTTTLYKDIFYNQIPNIQKIYVPLSLLESEEPDFYQNLGLRVIGIGSKYAFLYDEKQKIDKNSVQLAGKTYPNYENPILTKAPINVLSSDDRQNKFNIDTRYAGRGVLIGVISEYGVDYTSNYLRTSTGDTRILSYWVQSDGNDGTTYTCQDINKALASEDPNVEIPLETNEDYVMNILSLAGGAQKETCFLAACSQFMVAKIKPAPKILQAIYGGDVAQNAVLMPDILIAAYKMLRMAEEVDMPLVLVIPYNTNLSAHDGKGVYEQLLQNIASQQGCTVIVPTGDEGNKSHHVSIVRQDLFVPDVTLRVIRQTPILVGCIELTNFLGVSIAFCYGDKPQNSIKLNEEGRYILEDATIYTTGIMTNFQNGACVINFRIENMKSGRWQMKFEVNTIQTSTQIDIWLGQQALNPNVVFDPSNANITVGSNAAIEGLLSVGAFDNYHLVILASSGRGYDWNNAVVPFCATLGRVAFSYNDGLNHEMEGTIVSASLLAGIMALFYERWIVERGKPYPNSIVMQRRFINRLKQYAGIAYPNQSQGYGVFELQDLETILQQQSN